MNRRIAALLRQPLSLGVIVLAVTACSAAPTRYYTLLPPSATARAQPAQDPAFQFEVQTIDIPAQVDVQTLVVRESNGQLTPVETRRWIAPLASEIRSALSAALTQRLGVPEISGVAPDARLPLYRMQLSVRRFDSALAYAAQIEAVWTLRTAREPQQSVTCESRISVPVAAGYEALAEGHQRALVQIADAMAGALLALQSGRAATACIDPVR